MSSELPDPPERPGAPPPAPPRDAPAARGARRYWCRRVARTDEVVFAAEERRHLLRVMRHRSGDRVEAIDGSGRVLTVLLLPGRAGAALRGRILEARDEPAGAGARELWLGQGLIRPQRLEWLVEKAVELGVAGLVPLVTRQAQPHSELTAARHARLERVARAAVSQSLGVRLPDLRPPVDLAGLDLSGYERVLLAHGPAPSKLGALPAGGRFLVLVGPEGGFDPDEIADLEQRGAIPLGLGPRRLRSETAALVALALVALAPASP